MRRMTFSLMLVLLAAAMWAGINETPLQTKTMLKEQERTKTELKLQEQTKNMIQTEDCENLMLQVKNRTRTRSEYQENLEFMLSYAFRNKVQSAEELKLASEFFQENKGAVSGTAREKRQVLMTKAEARIKNHVKNQNMLKLQMKEKNQVKNSAGYKSGTQEKNMNKNQVQAEIIKQKRLNANPKR